MKKLFLAVLFLLFLLVSIGTHCMASHEPDGAALFNKQCAGCHHTASRMNPKANVMETVRHPPAAMPVFDKNKLPDGDVRAIALYIHAQIAVQVVCKAI